ncbi:MAG: metallophosphoesterase, partial [Lewinellaceae bacterium]|nr:metallophosphoesterase [Lewinellaceae bacterium]
DFVPIVSKGRGDTEDPVKDVNFALGYQLSTNKLAADFEDNINSANHPAIGNATLGNCWTHVAATYNSATGIWKLYVNGALDQTVDLGTAFVPQSLSDVKASIGTTFNADGVADGFFNGLIDEARIWNLVRSDGEIAADYAAELNSGPGLVARYGLNTGSGSTAINDLGPDGSIAGTPVWTAGFVPGAGGTADAGGPYTTCNTTPVNIMAITNSTGVWSGGLGTFGSTTSASTTYTPDVSEVGTNVTLTWTTDAGACDPVSDDAILTVNGQGAATSLDFNGSSDYVSFGAASPELNATSFTLEAWIKIEGAGVTTTTSGAGGGGFEGATAAVPIVTKGRGEGESPANINMNYFMGLVGNKLAADFEEPAGPNHSVIGNATLPSNTWTHIAATYDQPSGVWNLYINGALDKTLNLGTGFSPANTSIQHAAVGTAMNSTGVAAGFFNGLVDEVRIWNVARTPTEILDNYALELTGGTGLIGRWGFNEGCGLTATNSINASPNGTLSSANGPVWSTDIPSGPVAPDAPTLVSPANNATNIGLPPTLSWNAAAGATTYRVQLSLVSNFSSVEYDQSGLGTTSVSVPSLFENTLYYWRVNATNAGGTSDWSTVWSFTTAATGAYALDFNGSNNLVDCGNDASLHVTNFTLEAWIKIEAPGVSTSTGSGGITNIVPIIMKGRAEAESALVDVNYALGYQLSTNKLVADFEDNATSANHPAISNATLGNCWTHVAATYDVSGVWKLYINGVLDGTTNLGGAFTPQSLSDVKACIGSSFNSSGTAEGYFNGLIDEVRVWDVVRSDAEIAADYANDLNSGSGLTARYGFNTGNGSVAVNSLGPDGTISGTPVWVDGYAPAGTLASSLDFNGTTDYVTFGAAPELNATNFTLEAWIKIEGTGTTVSTGTGGITAVPIVTKGRGESETGNLNMNYFMGLIGNKLAADFEESTGPNHPVTGVADIPNNVWTHVAATYDVANAEWKLYINGVQDQTLDLGSNISPVGNSIQHAGVGTAMTSTGAVAGYFNGLIDEVRIWNVVRTQPEIQANYTMELTSGTGLIGRWGFNDGCGLTAVNSIPSSPNGTLSSATGPVWVLDSPVSGPINNAPDQPANPSPADLATAPSTSPDLCVDVSDPDGDALRVRYYARPKATAGAPFTIVWLPDTQYYVEEPQAHGGTPAMFNSQTAWVVNNEVAENIVYVGQLGDCVEHGDYPSNPTFGELEWDRAKTAMYALEPPEIPYGVCAGNHDQSPIGDPNGTTTRFNEAFGSDHFMGRPYYGGHYGNNNDNHFQIFSASGIDFMVISFEYDQSSNFNAANGPLDWAEDLVADSSHRKVIVMSHHVLSDNGNFSTQGQYIYNRLKAYPNFIMMVGGHDPGGDGEARRSDVNQIGMTNYTVHTILSDYQARTNGGNGLMRIFRFEPATNNVAVKTYSPFTNTYEQDGSSEFNLTVDLGGSQVPFVMIGELNDVPSGTSPCVNYAGLDGCTEYEWYVELFDGTATTTGPVWTFTTPGGGNATITPDGPTTFCEGGSVTLTASSGDSYLWSTMETTQSIVVTTSGSYTVEVTTAGCTGSSTSTEVTVNGLGTANAGADQMTCINGVVYLQGAVGGTSTGGTWSANVGGGTFFPSATNLVTFYIPPSGYSDPITLTLTGDGPCPASDDLVVTYGPLPPVTLTASGPTDATCGQDVVITIEVASGFTDIKSYQYVVEWDPLKFQYVTHNAPAIDGEPATVFTNNTSIGQLSYGWIDQSGAITGKTLSNGSTVLTVTLKPLVSSGMDEPVNIIGTVITPLEASNSQQCLLTLTPQNNVAIDFNPISVSCPANTMICSDASPLTLTGENPTGGSYSGTGVDMGMFDPAAAGTGPHEITYNYTDGNSCAAFCTFTITVIAPPTADAPGDVTACDSYTLPVLTVGNYFTGSGGTGTALNAGAAITSTQTLYVYAETGTTPNCTDENSFTVTINATPTADAPADVTACDSYTLPVLTVGNYFTGTNGTGTALNAGAAITSSQTLYVYAETGTTPNCTDENSFNVTINTTPTADAPADVTACDSYTLPVLTVGNYFTGTNGTGTALNAGDAITSTQTLYVYAETGTTPNCTDENSFTVTINATPTADAPADVTACDSYTLPVLTVGNYFTGTNGTGTALNAGDAITSTQTLYVYAETGTTPNCTDENSFNVTINTTPTADAPADVTACDSYTLPVLTVGNYFTGTNGTGTALNAGAAITSTQTLYVYAETGTTPNCTDENSFNVTINTTPTADAPADVTACDSYTLPVLTVGNYFTGTNGTGTALNAGAAITSSQTLYVYAETGTTPNCTDENSFNVMIIASPVADAPDDVTACDSYTLPVLTVGNYFTGTNGTGTALNAGAAITSSQTLYVYAETGTTPNCTDENSFTVTINTTPTADAPADVTACDSYTLPVLTVGNYFTGTNGTGTALNAGDAITSTQTLYVYAETGTTPNCTDENSFNVMIIASPVADAPDDVTACDSYTLPVLTVGNYFTGTNGTGTALNAGAAITSSQTLYVYAETGTTPNCTDENSFNVTINTTPTADAPADVTACDSYTLPVLTVGNYFTGTNGTGTALNAGAAITSTQTLYVYAETGTTPNCTDENSFNVTINTTPTADAPADVTACDSYTLPVLTVGNYFTGTNGTGTALNAGAAITSTQTLYVYAETGTTPNCTDENSFNVTINTTPTADAPADVTACDSYTLPVLTVGNYFTGTNGTGTALNAGDAITSSQTLYVYAETGTTPNCTDENSFNVTINTTPTADAPADVTACDSYTLPVLTVGNYFTGTNGTGTALNAGAAITSSQTLYVYAETGTTPNCTDENSFNVTINTTPTADAPADVTACDSYTLPVLTVGNYFTGTNGTGTALNAGDAITSSQTLYVYAETGTTPNCTDENSFNVTINTTPTADAPADVTVCDSYVLPSLTVGNYFTGANGTGTALNAGDAITSTQTLYVYAETGTTPNCTDENSFTVTIEQCIINFSGRIIWEGDRLTTMTGVKDVTTTLSGDDDDSYLTTATGDYTLVGLGSNFLITPVKNMPMPFALNGLTTADASQIVQHALNIFPILDPYKLIAADVNGTNTITTADASYIVQAILGNPVNQFGFINRTWRFVPKAYVFPNPASPWGYPQAITFTGISGDQTGQDFIGIKMGDVNKTANPANFGPQTAPSLIWWVQDRQLEQGEEFTAEFRADNLVDLLAYQFALQFDPAQLEFLGLEPVAGSPMDANNFGFYNLAAGEIRAALALAQPITLSDGTPVFRLKFRALQGGNKLGNLLHLSNAILQGEAYDSDYTPGPVSLVFGSVVTGTNNPDTAKLVLFQNQPNPFSGRTQIGFELPGACEATLRVFDVNGQLLREHSAFYAAGRHQVEFDFGNSGVSAMLYYELSTPFGVLAKKMVLSNE